MHWRKVQSKELRINGLLGKKRSKIQLIVPNTGAVIFEVKTAVYIKSTFSLKITASILILV